MSDYLYYIFTNPVFWTSIFAPAIFSLTFLWTDKLIRDNKGKSNSETIDNAVDETTKEDKGLAHVLGLDWAKAWNDFNNQLFIVVSSLIFAALEAFKRFHEAYKLSIKKDKLFLETVYSDLHTAIVFTIILLFVVMFIAFVIKGKFSSPKLIKLYITDKEKTSLKAPTLRSILTWFRVLIIIYSIYFMYWYFEYYQLFLASFN